MRGVFYLILLSLAVFIIFNCNSSKQSGITPEKIYFAQATPDTSRYERGINAIPERDAVFIEWVPVHDESIQHIRLYRSEEREGPYRLIGTAARSDTSYIDETVLVDVRYFYYAIAESRDGVASASSDTIHYTLLEKAVGIMPIGDIYTPVPEFSWENPNSPPEHAYMLRLQEAVSEKWIWNVRIPTSYSEFNHDIFNSDSNALVDSLVKNTEYRWRVDILGSQPFTGSKSQWRSFIIR